MACGKMQDFISRLHKQGLTQAAHALHKKLRSIDEARAADLLTEFNTAKSAMELRMKQLRSFWQQRPWNILSIGECLVVDVARQDDNQFHFFQGSELFNFCDYSDL